MKLGQINMDGKIRNIDVCIMIALLIGLSCAVIAEEVRQPLQPIFENSVLQSGVQKEVLASRSLVDMEAPPALPENVKVVKRQGKSGDKCLQLPSPGGFGLQFEEEDWTDYNRVFFWVYPEQPTEPGILYVSFGLSITDPPKGRKLGEYSSSEFFVRPNQWNPIIWEIPHLERKKVKALHIGFTNQKTWPEDQMDVTMYVDDIKLQKVRADNFEGWNVGKDKIAFSHIGYKPSLSKTAIGSTLTSADFEVIYEKSGKTVLKKPVKRIETRLGKFQVLDFTEVHRPGTYILKAGDIKSRPFSIKEDIWRDTAMSVLNFFYCQRPACEVPGYQPPWCYQDTQGHRPDQPHIRRLITKGWIDAGDLIQWTNNTANAVYGMFYYLDQLDVRGNDKEFYERMLEEANVGLNFILQTNFGDGQRIVQLPYNTKFTDGIVGNSDDTVIMTNNCPLKNLKCSAAEAMAYKVLKDEDSVRAKNCLRLAEDDWAQAVAREDEWAHEIGGLYRVHKNVTGTEKAANSSVGGPYYAASWGVISSVRLLEATGKAIYAEKAIEYGKILLDCQEQRFLLDAPITGYFYTNTGKKKLTQHFVDGRGYGPLVAFNLLCKEFSNHEDWIEWYAAMVVHSEYFLKMARLSEPYAIVPNSIYKENDYLLYPEQHQEEFLQEIREGINVGKDSYLRFFPPYVDVFSGANDIVLSRGLALCAAGQVRTDLASEELAQKQLQWILGRNPFSKSIAYGIGYDYHSDLGFSKGSMVGGIPVGMDSFRNDSPHWSSSSYFCCKEPWVQSSSRFIWDAAYLSLPALVTGKVNKPGVKHLAFEELRTEKLTKVNLDESGNFRAELSPGEYSIKFGYAQKSITLLSGNQYDLKLDTEKNCNFKISTTTEKNTISINLTAKGEGTHKFKIKSSNLNIPESQKEITLDLATSKTFKWTGKIIDADTPWVAVVIPNGDNTWQKEAFGQVKFAGK